MWNTGGLRADLGLVRDGGWDRLDDEVQKERQARKIEWLRTHVNLSEPTVVFLEEVTGSLGDAKVGLRRTFTRLGYATLMLPGAGGGAGTELSRAKGQRHLRGGAQEQCIFRWRRVEGCGAMLGSADQAHAGATGKALQSRTTSACTGFIRLLRRKPANVSSHSCGARWTGWSSAVGRFCWATSTEWRGGAASGGSGPARGSTLAIGHCGRQRGGAASAARETTTLMRRCGWYAGPEGASLLLGTLRHSASGVPARLASTGP